MPKAGKYDLPFFDLDNVLEKLKTAHDKIRLDDMDRVVVAETLGMSATGGGYAYLIGDMEKYGLIQTGRGKILITTLGKEAIYGSEIESKNAKEKAVSNITLFKDIYLQYGINITEEQTRAFLRQNAGIDVVKVQTVASNVLKIYKKISQYFEEVYLPEIKKINEEPTLIKEEKPINELNKDSYLKIQFGDVLIQLPQNDLNAILLAKNALEMMENYLRNKEKKE